MLAHILVVDDQPYLCELLSRIFIRDRYHIVCANNAESTEK
jgi:DNA-binding NtrC family response regulator